MKNSKVVFSTVLASLFLAGCNSHIPNNNSQKYVVVEEPYTPVASQPISNPDPRSVEVAPCCDSPQPNAQPLPEPRQQTQQPEVIKEVHYVEKKKNKKSELLKITGIGYGAESTYQAYTPGQRRLMAIRSSKLDAYRSLAEQIYGIKIDSNTSVSTLTAKNDSFRARINAVVRGARLVSVTPMADNNYETVLEVYVDKEFFEKAFVYSGEQEEVALEPESMYRFRTLR